MTKKLVIIVLAIVMLAGCATVKDWYCSNRTTIKNIITTANSTIDFLETTFDGAIPAQYQVIIDVARNIVTQGEAMLAAGCPTTEDVQALESQKGQMKAKLRIAGMDTVKRLK